MSVLDFHFFLYFLYFFLMVCNLKCWGNLREIGAEAIDPLEGHWSYDKNIAIEKCKNTNLSDYNKVVKEQRMESWMVFFCLMLL